MAAVRSLCEHRLLLHYRRSPWCSSRICLQAWCKGNGITYQMFAVCCLFIVMCFNSVVSCQGIWGGMIGGTCMQTAILLWVTLRTDWNNEVAISETIQQEATFLFPVLVFTILIIIFKCSIVV
jgi:hypothetical protein